MRSILAIAIFCVLVAEYTYAQASSRDTPLTISEATAFCESAIPQFCASTTCPQYCNTLRSRRSKSRCNSECTPSKRCKLKANAAQDDPRNQILDAQNRDQLFGCIAEKRDPGNTRTGRRDTPWQQLRSPSFERVILY